jgi:hypothetical protein
MTGRPSRPAWCALWLLLAPVAHAQSTATGEVPAPQPGSPVAGGGVVPAAIAGSECAGDRFVLLQERGFAPALASELRTDFATELAHRGISLCDAESSAGREPAAVVGVQANDAAVTISLDDRVTHKRVARDLSLQGIPANGRALAVAIAIDELLRASWAELTLRRPGALEPEEDDSDDYDSAARSSQPGGPRAHAKTRYQLGADLMYLHTSRELDAFALSVRATAYPWDWGWFVLELGGLGSVPVSSPRGDVLAAGGRSALTAGACSRGREHASTPGARVVGCGGARGELDLLMLRGLRPEMARANKELAAVVHASLVGSLSVLVHERTYLFGELSLGAVLQGTEATDGTRTILGITGMLFSLHVGMGYDL